MSQTYVADIFLAQSWRDARLRLPEYMSEDYRILDVDWLHNIWRPDCFFKNAKKVTFHEMSIPNHYLKYRGLNVSSEQTASDHRRRNSFLFCSQTDTGAILRYEVRVVSTRHPDLHDDD
ncbi:Glycine receptor subunit alpha-4 [Zootermopsis nevadensis]|uniref:Glycine receptor subunit alpha-4 n=1 Tax=Zootermopsis nevadensis TaxID=136037 RepID=A0A067QRG7_ZOONE|nr:Glycine receptor subunit alpha-4 [Zootermopsis nevadensis]